MSHLVSEINSLVLAVNLIPVSLSICDLPFPAPTTSAASVECQLTTLIIQNSFTLSLPAENLPLPQIFPTTDRFF